MVSMLGSTTGVLMSLPRFACCSNSAKMNSLPTRHVSECCARNSWCREAIAAACRSRSELSAMHLNQCSRSVCSRARWIAFEDGLRGDTREARVDRGFDAVEAGLGEHETLGQRRRAPPFACAEVVQYRPEQLAVAIDEVSPVPARRACDQPRESRCVRVDGWMGTDRAWARTLARSACCGSSCGPSHCA